MSRQFAPVFVDIWSNPGFTALSHHAQHLYLLALSHPTTTTAGVLDYRPKRLAALSATLDVEAIESAATELEEAGFLVIDRDTEEACVRSWFRNSLVLKQPNVAKNAFKSLLAVASPAIHQSVANELHRLDAETPTRAGLDTEEARAYLNAHPPAKHDMQDMSNQAPQRGEKRVSERVPETLPERVPNPKPKGSRKGSREGSEEGSPIMSNKQIVDRGGYCRQQPQGEPTSEGVSPDPENSSEGGEGGLGADAPAAESWPGHPFEVSDPEDARCAEHAGLERFAVPACGACGAARRVAADRLKNAREGASRGRVAEIGACARCDDLGWLKTASGVLRCGHGLRPDGSARDGSPASA